MGVLVYTVCPHKATHTQAFMLGRGCHSTLCRVALQVALLGVPRLWQESSVSLLCLTHGVAWMVYVLYMAVVLSNPAPLQAVSATYGFGIVFGRLVRRGRGG